MPNPSRLLTPVPRGERTAARFSADCDLLCHPLFSFLLRRTKSTHSSFALLENTLCSAWLHWHDTERPPGRHLLATARGLLDAALDAGAVEHTSAARLGVAAAALSDVEAAELSETVARHPPSTVAAVESLLSDQPQAVRAHAMAVASGRAPLSSVGSDDHLTRLTLEALTLSADLPDVAAPTSHARFTDLLVATHDAARSEVAGRAPAP